MKKWYRSRTVIANAVAIVGMTAEYLVAKQILSPELHILGLAILNIILRTITSKGLVK